MENNIEELKSAIHAALDERTRIAEPEHKEHHDWLRERIQKEQARTIFWQGLAQKTLPGLIATLAMAALGWLWHFITTHIKWS